MTEVQEQVPQTVEKHKIKEPEKPEINVSSKKDPKSYKIVVKLVLRKFGYCELKSLGNASESVVKIAESLIRNEIATIDKIESGITELEDLNNETGTRQGITFIVKLGKGKRFDELTQNLE
jgi:hypothetical protein